MAAISPAHRARFFNLRAIQAALGTKAELAAVLKKNPAQLQATLGTNGCTDPAQTEKRIGERQARDIEAKLALPDGVLDIPEGIKGHLADLVTRIKDGLLSPEAAIPPARKAIVARLPRDALTHLQLATLDALRSAMVDGRLGERDCLTLLDRWTAPAAESD